MKNISFIAFIIACGSMVFAACQKDESTEPEPDNVTMNISSPAPGEVFRSGDTIHLHATASFDGQLHGYSLTITDTAHSETVLFETEEHVHGSSFSVDTFWVPALSTNTGLRLTLTTEIDHEGHEASKEVLFSFQP